jgi:hypothetical protein
VTCGFDLAHYAELLDAAVAGGYRFVFFDHEPGPGDLFLRHDVDLSLDAAIHMANREHERGIGATYFLMTRSDFYNLGTRRGELAIHTLRALGHRVGLHGVHPHAALDDRFDPVLAWHTPDPATMSEPVDGAVNVYAPPWFDPGHYRSDSNQHWRNGCPHDDLRAGRFDWLQLLVHPEIWVYPGETMRETMEAFLDAERGARRTLMLENRIDLS